MNEHIKELLIKAGDEILKYFGTSSVLYTKKTVTDVVTEADLASNTIICDAIKEMYPTHGIVSEEGDGYQTESEYLWYVDPLDGTKNFSTHTPLFGINIALTFKGEIVFGAIYLPITKDYCYAEKGKGAYLNDIKITCSQKEDFKGSFGLGGIRPTEQSRAFLQKIDEISEHSAWVNAVASSAVSGLWIAAGKRDWYIGPGRNAWDYAATALIAEEAGAVVTNYAGAPYKCGDKGIVIANRVLHPTLLKFIKESYNS
jgi:myo-inositol-1(or 4)-monophosphatase